MVSETSMPEASVVCVFFFRWWYMDGSSNPPPQIRRVDRIDDFRRKIPHLRWANRIDDFNLFADTFIAHIDLPNAAAGAGTNLNLLNDNRFETIVKTSVWENLWNNWVSP